MSERRYLHDRAALCSYGMLYGRELISTGYNRVECWIATSKDLITINVSDTYGKYGKRNGRYRHKPTPTQY
jgi:hypothetical protein